MKCWLAWFGIPGDGMMVEHPKKTVEPQRIQISFFLAILFMRGLTKDDAVEFEYTEYTEYTESWVGKTHGHSPQALKWSWSFLIQSPQHVMGRLHLWSRIQWFSCFEAVGMWGNSNLSSGQRHCHVLQKLRMICFMVLLQCSKIHFIAAIYFTLICPHLISETKLN